MHTIIKIAVASVLALFAIVGEVRAEVAKPEVTNYVKLDSTLYLIKYDISRIDEGVL